MHENYCDFQFNIFSCWNTLKCIKLCNILVINDTYKPYWLMLQIQILLMFMLESECPIYKVFKHTANQNQIYFVSCCTSPDHTYMHIHTKKKEKQRKTDGRILQLRAHSGTRWQIPRPEATSSDRVTYVESIITPMDPDLAEQTYRGIKKILVLISNMRTDNKGVSTLKENSIILSDPKDKADGLNR